MKSHSLLEVNRVFAPPENEAALSFKRLHQQYSGIDFLKSSSNNLPGFIYLTSNLRYNNTRTYGDISYERISSENIST